MRALRVLVLLAAGVAAMPAAAQQPTPVRINYVNADLADVIRSLATVLGVNVVLTDVPSRRITFQTPEPVPAAQVGAVLEAILESQSLVIVQTGPVAQMPESVPDAAFALMFIVTGLLVLPMVSTSPAAAPSTAMVTPPVGWM